MAAPHGSKIHMSRGLVASPMVYLKSRKFRAIPHNSKCRYGERGAADAKPKAQIILDAAKVSAASGGNSEPKQGQRSQSARGFCPRSTMRVPQPDIIEHFGNADAVPQPPERCLSRKAGIVRCCLSLIMFPRGPVLPDIRRTGPHLSCCRARRSRSADCRWSGPDYRTGS